jgi:hypothetical protein
MIMLLNNALFLWILAGHNGFVTAAGYLGPKCGWDMTSTCSRLKSGAGCPRKNTFQSY